MKKQPKRILFLLSKIHGSYHLVAKKTLHPTDVMVKFSDEHSYMIDQYTPFYMSYKKIYFFHDLDNNKPIRSEVPTGEFLTPSICDAIASERIFTDVGKNLNEGGFRLLFGNIAIGLLIGIPVTAVIFLFSIMNGWI